MGFSLNSKNPVAPVSEFLRPLTPGIRMDAVFTIGEDGKKIGVAGFKTPFPSFDVTVERADGRKKTLFSSEPAFGINNTLLLFLQGVPFASSAEFEDEE